ncbi:hypothetical protein Q9Q94_02995 [Uliginosibacterium sp. 31-16]|uniref:hypothetical protein n=1 Tax=Uliginosibacterium sp. 31-16 TaxID=3068315 RepID=UPI00273DF49F|nr:hypothetical protein [Uliginosibacterium sp. 31-16]MDP5238477.1 hypothetical protein [Uliginosibacterium sp. 31-16]
MAAPEKIVPFARPAGGKEERLAHMRQRFSAATPATRPPVRETVPRDVRRMLMAAVLVLILLGAILLGSGVL